jgi:hypothetical protein
MPKADRREDTEDTGGYREDTGGYRRIPRIPGQPELRSFSRRRKRAVAPGEPADQFALF